MRDFEGKWITDPVQAFQYDRVQEYEIAASKSAGFKNPGSLYKYRKGAAANLSKECLLLSFLYINLFVGHLDEHSRNNIMGHTRSGTFAHYVQVRDDTQSAFMETPARDALLKLSSNASLTRDISAPQDLTGQQKQELEKHPELSSLKRECNNLRNQLIATHYQLYKGRGTELYNEFKKIQNKIRAKRKKLHDSAKKQQYNEFF